MKKTPVISVLVALGFAVGIEGKCADPEYVEQQAATLRWYAASKDPRYFDQLYEVAGLYHLNGMHEKADQAFQEYLQLWRQKPHKKSESTFMLEWANWLTTQTPEKPKISASTRHANLLKASQITDEALARSNKIPPTSEEKFKVLFAAAENYKASGDITKQERVVEELDRTLRAMEQENKPSEDRVYFIVERLTQLADFYCPMLRWRQARNQKQIALVPNSAPKGTNGVRAHDFEVSEKYRIRIAALLDKLPPGNDVRIEVQRSLVSWYRTYGQTAKYNAELKKLSCLLGSNDLKVLLPPKRGCEGCGMG